MKHVIQCPFCGHKGEISYEDYKFVGYTNDINQKVKRYQVQIMCNKCHKRSTPITTENMVDVDPSSFKYWGCDKKKRIEKFITYFDEAIELWN